MAKVHCLSCLGAVTLKQNLAKVERHFIPMATNNIQIFPVDRKLFNIDVKQYWRDRAAGAK